MRAALFSGLALLAITACGPSPTPSSSSTAGVTSTAAAAVEPDPAALQAAIAALPAPYNGADYAAGRRVFAQCRSCHTLEAGGPNRVGPNLHGVFGRHIGTAPGFNYSDALKNADFVWDGAQLDHWLENPQADLPGNRMGFAGLRNETQRRDVIAYLMVETAR